jgi:hypothetical protein
MCTLGEGSGHSGSFSFLIFCGILAAKSQCRDPATVQGHEALSTYICRIQSSVWRLPKLLTLHPLSSHRVCPPPAPKAEGGGGKDTRRAVRVWGGVNILEDVRHWMASYSLIPLRHEGMGCLAQRPIIRTHSLGGEVVGGQYFGKTPDIGWPLTV